VTTRLSQSAGTFYINDAAESRLTGPGGGVDMVMAAPIATSRAVAVDAVKRWDFVGSMLEADLRARGVDDPLLLPDYPFRDDARLIHGALRDWVEDYVRIWYTGDTDVRDDAELQAWVAEMGAPDGGRLAGVPAVQTVATLIAVVTHVVFTASAQHAAVNFPQGPLMAYAPSFPLSTYAPVGDGDDEAAWLATLPPLGLAQLQGALGALLGGVHHTQLGRYPVPLLGHFAHEPRTAAPLAALQARLEAIERTIAARNHGRVPYPFLLPSQIPQSTNI
jgi:arachidonate 15-lipoxygenase